MNLEMLEHTLAQTLRDYPHFAERLSFEPETQQWCIILNNHSVPVTLGSTQHLGIFTTSTMNAILVSLIAHHSRPCDGANNYN